MQVAASYIDNKNKFEIIKDYEISPFGTNSKEFLLKINNIHYKINLNVYNLIQLLSKNYEIVEIAREYSTIYNYNYSVDEIILLIDNKLRPLGLLKNYSNNNKSKSSSSILWIRLPVFSASFLLPFTRILQKLFKREYFICCLLLGIIIHIILIVYYFPSYNFVELMNNPYSTFFSVLILFTSSIFHELGHVSSSHYFGVKHKEVGFGMYFMFPVLYANITNAWGVSGKKRVIIDVAGLYFQFLFNILLFFLFFLSNKNIIYIHSIKLILFQSVFLTLNPFLRFDGYWIVSDALGIANLRKKSKEYIQYLLKKHIFRDNVSFKRLSTNAITNNLFVFYAFSSSAFFIFFSVLLIKRLPKRIYEFPNMCSEVYASILGYYISSDWRNIVISGYQFFLKLLLLLISIYVLFRISSRFWNIIKPVIFK